MTAVFSIALEHLGTIGDSIMANYYATARSNYFKVNQPKKFIEWIHKIPNLTYDIKEKASEENDMVVMIYIEDMDGGGWPTYAWDEETDDEYEIDICAELAQFLVEDEVAILMEVGAEKIRYVSGVALAVNHKGEVLVVTLNDIYNLVRDEWGIENISVAEY